MPQALEGCGPEKHYNSYSQSQETLIFMMRKYVQELIVHSNFQELFGYFREVSSHL